MLILASYTACFLPRKVIGETESVYGDVDDKPRTSVLNYFSLFHIGGKKNERFLYVGAIIIIMYRKQDN
jgi:hypothetical protein